VYSLLASLCSTLTFRASATIICHITEQSWPKEAFRDSLYYLVSAKVTNKWDGYKLQSIGTVRRAFHDLIFHEFCKFLVHS